MEILISFSERPIKIKVLQFQFIFPYRKLPLGDVENDKSVKNKNIETHKYSLEGFPIQQKKSYLTILLSSVKLFDCKN